MLEAVELLCDTNDALGQLDGVFDLGDLQCLRARREDMLHVNSIRLAAKKLELSVASDLHL